MVDICIGIISYLPDNKEVRKVRFARLNSLLNTLNYTFNLPLIIIAQNYSDENIEELKKFNNIFLLDTHDKLGITLARETLRKAFCEKTSFTNMICLDDDFELNKDPKYAQEYITIIKNNHDKVIEYQNFLMNLAVLPRYIAKENEFDLSISAELGTGYEDWVYISRLQQKNYPYKKVQDFGLIPKKGLNLQTILFLHGAQL